MALRHLRGEVGAEVAAPRRWSSSFRALLGAQVCSTFGDGIRQVAFPALAATLTQDPVLVAGLTFALMLPWLLFSLHAGAIADRVDRRSLLVIMSAARVALLLLLAASVVTGTVSIAILYAVAFTVGVTHVVFTTTAQAVVPATVERHQLEPANARIASAEIVGNEFAGPLIGGVLFALAMVAPFLAIAALAVLGMAAAWRMRGDFRPVQDPAENGASLLQNIVVGLRWLAGHRVLRVVAVVAAVMAFVDTAALAILVLYAREILGVGEVGFGLLLGIAGVGGITGSLLSGRIARGPRSRPVILTSVALPAAAQLGLAAATAFAMAAAALFVASLAYGLWGVVSLTLRQRLAPDALLGRAGAGHRLLALGFSALGALFGGFVARAYGLRATYLVGALVLVAVFVAVALLLTRERIAEAEAAADTA
jgi:predicted MFS family arabinose efflux permease